MAAPCCPPGSLGAASFKQGPTKGKMVTLSAVIDSEDSSVVAQPDMQCYQIGPSKPKYVIVVFSDVFGIESGNQKVYCDTLQACMGEETAVWMPDMFRGDPIITDWFGSDTLSFCLSFFPTVYKIFFKVKVPLLEQDLLQIVHGNVKVTGCELVGCTGFCWGGWEVAQALSLNEGNSVFSAGVGIHPSWKPETLVSGGTTQTALGERTGNKPLLLLPAKQDKEFFRDTDLVKQLADQRGLQPSDISVEFADMDHGFVARGNPNKEHIRKSQEKAVNLVVDFFEKHFKMAEK